MNYKRTYNSIVENRINTPFIGYTENHHILPKSLGGSDDKTNIGRLSAKEHFICHHLLVGIHKNNVANRAKMVKAFMNMLWCRSNNQERYITSREFSQLREEFAKNQSICQSGNSNSQYGTMWITDGSKSIKIIKGSDIPSGWKKGRILDGTKIKNDLKVLKNKIKKELKEEELIKYKAQKKIEFTKYLAIYEEFGFKILVEMTGFQRTQSTFCIQLGQYLDDYNPVRYIKSPQERQIKK